MADATDKVARAPQHIERLVKQLNIAAKAVKLYPDDSDMTRDAAFQVMQTLRVALERQPLVQLTVTRDALYSDGCVAFPDSEAFSSFAREFYLRNLSEIRLHAGLAPEELLKFLGILKLPPEALATAGGVEAYLWEVGVSNITVVEVSTKVVDHEAVDEEEAAEVEGEAWPPDPGRIEEMLAGALAGRPRDQRLLVRVIRTPNVLADYLVESAKGRGVKPEEGELASRVATIANAVRFELPEDQATLLRCVADAVMDLEPGLRSRLVGTRLLEDARLDDMVGQVVEQMSLDEIFDSIMHDMKDTPESRAGLSRAIRNVALVNVSASRDALMQQVSSAMRSRGASEAMVGSVLSEVSPQKLQVADRARTSEAKPIENILRLIDLAPERSALHSLDDAMMALRNEATRGITDGDVMAALVSLSLLDKRPDQFASIMTLLEDSIGLLIDLQEFEVAADVAEALTGAESDPELGEPQKRRITEVLAVLSRPAAMRQITSALRLYANDSPEHAACRKLLTVLGEHTIGSLLEVLAAEQDMQSRKSIVDLVSGMAKRYIPELGARVSDPRWFFVRNVVAILGATRERSVLPYLERTLRHNDGRVRREAIRALSSVRDALSDEMLMSALQDEDAQNVQLAARYLGSLGIRGAAPALEQVALGDGRGNRENGPRAEAVEALGRLAAPSSVPVLQRLSKGTRGIMGARRDREIKAAADAALGAIKARGSGGGEA